MQILTLLYQQVTSGALFLSTVDSRGRQSAWERIVPPARRGGDWLDAKRSCAQLIHALHIAKRPVRLYRGQSPVPPRLAAL